MNTFGEPSLVSVLVVLAIVIVVFLVIREVLCWYWKLNQIVSLLTEIRGHLANIQASLLQSQPAPGNSAGQVGRDIREPTI